MNETRQAGSNYGMERAMARSTKQMIKATSLVLLIKYIKISFKDLDVTSFHGLLLSEDMKGHTLGVLCILKRGPFNPNKPPE